MLNSTAEVVICGAGIAGIAAAQALAEARGLKNVVLVDERPPLSLTSDKSTECYRNWWPGPDGAMVQLMNRSIDLLDAWAEATGNAFHLNRRGYVYATADPTRVPDFIQAAEAAAALGAGSARGHRGRPGDPPYLPAPAEGFAGQPDGADVILDPALIRQHFPYLSQATIAVLHARRCGWFSAQQLGMHLLERARHGGVRLVQARVEGVEVEADRVRAVHVRGPEGAGRLRADCFVNAAGPFLKDVGRMVGADLPVFAELHTKLAFSDHLGVVPRHAPLLIWSDPQVLPWETEEREMLSEAPDTQWLLAELPAGAHLRPEGPSGSPIVLMLWDYHGRPVEPVIPPAFAPEFPDVVLRGLVKMMPGLAAYIDRAPKPVLDGGYYIKTRENRPLIGPLPVSGAYVLGAFSGFGIMAAPAAGELLAAHITGEALPEYAAAFGLERYADPAYLKRLEDWGTTGQL